MKKLKVTKRPGARDFILKPSRLRMSIIYILLFILALAIGFLIRVLINDVGGLVTDLRNSWDVYLGIILLGPVILAFVEYRRWTLRVLNGDRVEGPSGPFGERREIGLNQIDWERTSRSLTSRFKMANAIYASSRDRILLNAWFYPTPAFEEFLELIGFNKKNR